jgi:acyl-CoA synthetase (AMP-forming)/AMP-acid ligase II
MGYMDEKGYLFIMDRSKDMIISGGENIYPREIEEVLIRHEAVREVAVIGIPDVKWGEAIKAVVATHPGASVTEEELISFCRHHIASYKKPKSVDFVDALPKNNYGKILKRDLRAGYWKEKGAEGLVLPRFVDPCVKQPSHGPFRRHFKQHLHSIIAKHEPFCYEAC